MNETMGIRDQKYKSGELREAILRRIEEMQGAGIEVFKENTDDIARPQRRSEALERAIVTARAADIQAMLFNTDMLPPIRSAERVTFRALRFETDGGQEDRAEREDAEFPPKKPKIMRALNGRWFYVMLPTNKPVPMVAELKASLFCDRLNGVKRR